MKIRLLATALAVATALTPGLAGAMCNGQKHVSACQSGQVWDAAAERCVPSSS